MLHLTDDVLLALAQDKLAAMGAPSYVTVAVKDRLLTFDSPDVTTTVEMLPEFLESADIDRVLRSAITTIGLRIAQKLAEDAWERRPWWVNVCALTPGLGWLGMRWVVRRSKRLMQQMTTGDFS